MSFTAPRTWVAAEIVTAAIMNTHVRDNLSALADRLRVVRKTSNETVVSATALQDDDELLFTVVAGQNYEFDGVLFTSCVSAAANGDLVLAFTFPTGTMNSSALGPHNTALTGGTTSAEGEWVARVGETSSPSTVIPIGLSTAGTVTAVHVRGNFLATASGTVRLRWAQLSSSANGTRLYAGSFLAIEREAA